MDRLSDILCGPLKYLCRVSIPTSDTIWKTLILTQSCIEKKNEPLANGGWKAAFAGMKADNKEKVLINSFLKPFQEMHIPSLSVSYAMRAVAMNSLSCLMQM